jgi:aspartate aminotransferase
MFQYIQAAPPDSILGLNEAFQRDPRKDKINLSVGIFKDAAGRTPVLQCVKGAEKKLLETEATKNYLPIDGLAEYGKGAIELAIGNAVSHDRVVAVQTPGGTGALRVLSDFIAGQLAGSRIWISLPTWDNHPSIFTAAGVDVETYPYLNAAKTGLDFEAMLAALRDGPKTGDVVLLHACCHNPTGVDPTASQWEQIAEVIAARGLLPMVDFAYQGFGDGLNEDRLGIEVLLKRCPEMIIASSFSKNFGLYSERVGAAILVAADPSAAQASLSQLKRCVRTNYSNPPRHGAAVVATVLGTTELNAQWHQELAQMRERISAMRQAFVDGMHDRQKVRDYRFLLSQKGMFSFSGLTPMQVDQLRSQHGVYVVGSGRINVAGITPDNLDPLCDAIASVIA